MGDDAPDPADRQRSELIDAIYDAAIDPASYDRFMEAWGAHLSALMDPASDSEIRAAVSDLELHAHFERADRLSAALRKASPVFPTPDSLTETDPAFSIVIGRDGTMVSMSEQARRECGWPLTLDGLCGRLDPESANRLRSLLKLRAGGGVRAAGGSAIAVLRMSGTDARRPILLSLRPADIGARDEFLLLRAIQVDWSPALDATLEEGFALTGREIDVVRKLVAGQSLNDIAGHEGRSLNTLRTQLKSVLRKTSAGSQPELVRLVASLCSMLPPDKQPAGRTIRYGTLETVVLRDGRRMPVNIHGPRNGVAVVFVHGMLDGIAVTEKIAAALAANGIRLIAPARPCFGVSDPLDDKENAPESFAADLEDVLDRLGVEKAVVFGHKAGSVYAFAAAALFPRRYSGVLIVSGGVPIVSRRQFRLMKPRQQLVALTARFAPPLLPWILKKGIAQIRSGGERAFMDSLYRHAPHDHLVATDPSVFPVIRDGYHFTVAQGPRAFEIDSFHVTRDWSAYVTGSAQPALVLHGALDPVVDLSTVREFAARHRRVTLRVKENAGQLLFYEYPEYVQAAVLELAG